MHPQSDVSDSDVSLSDVYFDWCVPELFIQIDVPLSDASFEWQY